MYGSASDRTLALWAGVSAGSLIVARIVSADCTRGPEKKAAVWPPFPKQYCVLLDRQLLGRGGRFLRQRQLEHAVGILGARPGLVDLVREPEGARDFADVALAVEHALAVLRFLRVARFGGNRHLVAVDVHLDVFLPDSGKLGYNFVVAVLLGDVHL